MDNDAAALYGVGGARVVSIAHLVVVDNLRSRKLYFFVLQEVQRKCDALHCLFEESYRQTLPKGVRKTAAFR